MNHTDYSPENNIVTVTGSMTVKNKSFLWPLLVGIGSILVFICLSIENDNKTCSGVPAAEIAANPNLERSLEIHQAKNICIKQRICHPNTWTGSYPCEFTVHDLKECEDIDPALADYKIARRHLEAQVETCQLREEDRDGVTVYLWTEE